MTAGGLDGARHFAPYIAFVEGVRALAGDGFERPREVLLDEDFAGDERRAVPREYVARVGESRELAVERGESAGELLADCESVFGVSDCGFDERGEGHRPEAVGNLFPN